MKLTGKLKEKVERAENKEQVKEIIEDAGMILDDAELDQVAGGEEEYPKAFNAAKLAAHFRCF